MNESDTVEENASGRGREEECLSEREEERIQSVQKVVTNGNCANSLA